MKGLLRAQASEPLRIVVFVLLSVLLHAWLLGHGVGRQRALDVELALPEHVEIGLVDGAPGPEGAPGSRGAPEAADPPAPEPAPKAPKKERPAPPPPQPQRSSSAMATTALELPDASVASNAASAPQRPDTRSAPAPSSPKARARGKAQAKGSSGAEVSLFGQGTGLGFGAGGFGSALGGPPGAVVGLHLDVERIRDSSLVLEARALLDIIPQWRWLLRGSGLDPVQDFSRLFIATPNLRRTHLVLSARLVEGHAPVRRAAERLARAKAERVAWRQRGGLEVGPWYNRGPNRRAVGLLPRSQFVVAPPGDVSRVLAVATAIGRRHARQPGIERLPGAASLLAMYPEEAAALSIENAPRLIPDVQGVPQALRFSITPLDEFYATLHAYGYYESPAAAEAAMQHLKAARRSLSGHSRVVYLGLESALNDASLERSAATVELRMRLTLHQTRYLMRLVSRALSAAKK